MFFSSWEQNNPLSFNELKFYEPCQNAQKITPDLIIVPLLAFDKNGYRLGYGKGYYDKFYEKNKNIPYIGFGYSFQHIDILPTHKYDLRLNTIITDKYIKNVN